MSTKNVNSKSAKSTRTAKKAPPRDGKPGKPTRDLSIFALWPAEDCYGAGDIAVHAYGPMADSPIARRLQVFMAGAVEGGLSGPVYLSILIEWSKLVLDRLPRSCPKDERLVLARTIDAALLVRDAWSKGVPCRLTRIRLEARICSGDFDLFDDFDCDLPAIGTAHELVTAARDLFSPQSNVAAAAWGATTIMLGALSECVAELPGTTWCAREEALESMLQRCAGIAYQHIFGARSQPTQLAAVGT